MALSRETIRAIEDVRALLEFLGRRADSVLLSQFKNIRKDTRASATPRRQIAVPPCEDYEHFVDRLTEIESKIDPRTELPPAADNESKSSDLAFLYMSRDFLAALSAPATVDSIRTTAAYVEARGHPFLSRLRAIFAQKGELPEKPDEYARRGGRLARTVKRTQLLTFAMTLLTMTVSIYALSGRMILDKQQRIYAEYAEVGRERGELGQELATPAAQQADAGDLFDPPPGCDPANPKLLSLKPVPRVTQAALRAAAGNDPPAPPLSPAVLLASRKCALYWKTRQATQDIAAVTLHLMSWTHVVIGGDPLSRSPTGGAPPWGILRAGQVVASGISDSVHLFLSHVFGISPKFISEEAQRHAELCQRIGGEFDTTKCSLQLIDLTYRNPEVVGALLGAITLYLLPALYGFLGAAAATFRGLRRKVDLSLVTITDRGRVWEGAILGLLCGAVIGLFAGYIDNATPTTGLGLSALALLAGFNVPLVFAFFDEISNRLFRPASPACSGHQG
ncbi:MAG TPA: hypothetical protein VGM07_20150 [Stellaceae bacterium]|jgi:hypothetical protein